MFSPNGYVSFLKAYKVVKEHYEKSDLDLEHLFNFSFDTYGGERSANLAKVYSEREVLEKTLFQIIEGFDYYVCSEMGEVFQFDLPVYLNLVKMRELKGLYGFDEEYFDHHISWPDYEHIIDENLTKGADPWQATFGDFPNTSLNIYYSRETFLIDDTGYLDLNRYCNQMFFPEHYGYPFSHETIQKFNGWSLCLKSEDFQLIHQDNVKEIFFKIDWIHLMGSLVWVP